MVREVHPTRLNKPSAVKPVLFTAEKRILLKRLERLKEGDRQEVREETGKITG